GLSEGDEAVAVGPAPLFLARRGLRGDGERRQGGAGVSGCAAVQALSRRGVDEPWCDCLSTRRSVEGDLVLVARGGEGAVAAQGPLQLCAAPVGEEGAGSGAG